METTINHVPEEIGQAIRDAFIQKMETSYQLIYTDYNDTFSENPKRIDQCINENCISPLFDSSWLDEQIYSESTTILHDLKEKILSDENYKNLHPYLLDSGQLADCLEEIRHLIEERDESQPIQEMIDRTNLRARVTLFTNYDSLPHNYDMGNTYAYEGYFKDIVDVLHLNPAEIKNTFRKFGIKTLGRFPNLSKRNGQEAVSYRDFAEELLNQCCYGQLVFMGMLPLSNWYAQGFEKYTKITIPAGNLCGLFNFWNGGGALMEMRLLRDLTIPAQFPRKTKYDHCSLCLDEPNCGNGYCIDQVYGLVSSAWKKEFQLTF